MENTKAFPHYILIAGDDNTINLDEETSEHLNGMDLRDYFAAKAMQGLLSNTRIELKGKGDELIETSYKLADKMIKQRNK